MCTSYDSVCSTSAVHPQKIILKYPYAHSIGYCLGNNSVIVKYILFSLGAANLFVQITSSRKIYWITIFVLCTLRIK